MDDEGAGRGGAALALVVLFAGMASKARRIVTDLYDQFVEEPSILPTEWYAEAEGGDTQRIKRVVADYIAGMTDRYALREHERIFDRHSQI